MTGPPEDLTSREHRFSYDRIAADYSAYVDHAPYNALYERPAMLSLLPDLNGLRILDAGCGSGWYAERLLERGAAVDAIDASAAMVDHARKRINAPEARFSLRVADLADRLPFDDSTFDGVVSPLVLHYLKDWRPTLREMNRVMKREGWLLFSTHHPAADAELFATQNYFATEHVVDHWEWVGRVEFYRRPLMEIVDSLSDSGFVIEKLVEPVPTDQFRHARPDAYERLMHQPAFLMIFARPIADSVAFLSR